MSRTKNKHAQNEDLNEAVAHFFGCTRVVWVEKPTQVRDLDDLYVTSLQESQIAERFYLHQRRRRHQQQRPEPLNDDTCLIPKVIHFIWLGTAAVPSHKESVDRLGLFENSTNTEGGVWNECMESWRRHHPDWTIHLWTNDASNQFVQTHSSTHVTNAFSHAMDQAQYGMASDILRLQLLYTLGGVYVDVDYWCVSSIDELLSDDEFICGASHTHRVELNNGFLASRPGHDLVQQMLFDISYWWEQIKQNLAVVEQSPLSAFLDASSVASLAEARPKRISYNEVLNQTGPGLLTKVLARALLHKEKYPDKLNRVAIVPAQVFHPLSNQLRNGHSEDDKEIKTLLMDPTITKAVHLWGCSWQT